MLASVSGRRFSSFSVSGRRNAAQRPTATDTKAMNTKIRCQSPARMISWPIIGANTGTTMKTIITSDMVAAMPRPEWVSRTTERAITRVAAAPTALQKPRQQQEFEARREGAGNCADCVERDADKQRRAAAVPVGDGAEEQLRAAKPDDVGTTGHIAPGWGR